MKPTLRRVYWATASRARRFIRPEWQRAYRSVAYRGRRFYCPCCRRTARRFRRFGSDKNSRCPWCGSLQRQRAMWLYLQRETDVASADMRLLHVAPEEALVLRLKGRPNVHYVRLDVEPERPCDVFGDLTRAPFVSGSFDLILCSHVLEHIPDDRAAMNEITRLLSPKGRAILLVPLDDRLAETDEDPSVTDPKERARRFGQHNHVRMYGRDFVDRLSESGLDVDSIDYTARLDGRERERMLVHTTALNREQLFICRPA